MQKLKNILLVTLTMIALKTVAQKQGKVIDYINQFKELAIAEMQRTGVPAAITLAQGIHESGAGASKLALASNNHFGIKCKSNWTGESVKHDDDARGECFRKYPNAEDSYKDHSDFLKNGQRYAFLFLLDPMDFEGWANGLKKAGYATNPKYPQVLIKLINDYELQDYSILALGKVPETEIVKVELNSKESAVSSIALSDLELEENASDPVVTTTSIYPEGEFKINETRVLFVKKGTSYLSIATQYEIDLSKIFEFNDMTPLITTASDQLVYIQRKRKTGNDDFHIVKNGETLYKIAQLQAIRLESLQELNWLKKNDIPAVGEKLSLKAKSSNMPKLALRENFSLSTLEKIK